MSVASGAGTIAEPMAPPIADETATTAPEETAVATEAPNPAHSDDTTDATVADSDDACFRLLLDGLDPDSLVARQIRTALDRELDAETLLDRLAEALADEGATDDELRDATPALAAIALRSVLQTLGDDQPERTLVQELTPGMVEAIQALIETGVPDAIQALPGMMRQLTHRADRDHIGGIDIIPVLRWIAERVALDPNVVRRLSGRGPLSRPPATAAHGAAKFRQQPMRCRIDGPVEIIIVRR